MKLPAISSRTVEILVGLLATLCLALGLLLYALNEPQRIQAAALQQQTLDLDAAMTLYAENCSVCHGLAGEGISSIPALDRPALREMDPLEMAKVIARGRFNTAMPAWGLQDGGPLSAYQIEQMVLLVQKGDWPAVQDRVVNLGLAPRVPFTTQPDPAILEQVKALPNGAQIARGVTLFAEQCVACHGADGAGSALAPALNADTTRARSVDEITRIINSGVAGTLMSAWSSKLPAEDVAALVALIKNWDKVPAGAIPAPDQPIPVTAESLVLGQQLFSANCTRCHGPEGQGRGQAPALNVRSFLTRTNDTAMQQIISLGVPNTAMPVWGDRLSKSEIQAIVGFIRSWEPTAPEVATPARGPWWRASNGQTLPSGGVQGGGKNSSQGQGQTGGGQGPLARLQGIDLRSLLLLAGLAVLAGLLIWGGLRGLRQAAAREAAQPDAPSG